MNARTVAVLAGLVLGLALGACRLENKDHCANQDQAGNDYCAGINSATPFCSPCHAKNHGCLPFEPVSCEAYQGTTGPDAMDSSSSSSGA